VLTIDDESTIRFAIERRLKTERNVYCLEVLVQHHPRTEAEPGFIAVGVLSELDNSGLITRSVFHLPE
jgi:hypothetical protein